MSEFTTIDFAKKAYITRGPELISVGDNDIVSFTRDILAEGANPSMIVGGASLYASDATDLIEAGDRVMMWGRISSATGDLSGPLRWLSYFTPDGSTVGNSGNSGADSIAVIRDAFSPRVTYDKQSNRLSLWFWTNVKESYLGTTYDPSELYTVETSANSLVDAVGRGSDFGASKKVLCYAVGSFYHQTIAGGEITGLAGLPASTGFDIVPIFNTPQIISYGPSGSQNVGVMVDYLDIEPQQKIRTPLQTGFLFNRLRYTKDTDVSPKVIAGDTDQEEFEIFDGVITLDKAHLAYTDFLAVLPLPVVGTPTIVYIKITDFCKPAASAELAMFDVEKTEMELQTDLASDIKWFKVADIEVVEPQQSSSDLEYKNESTVADGWDHWYIKPYNDSNLYISQGDRIEENQGSANPVWFAKATEDSSSATFTGDIYGNGPSVAATITGVTIQNPTLVEVVTGDLLSVIQDCDSFFLTKKGGSGGGGGACIDIILDGDFLLARDFAPKTVVQRGHTDPNTYNLLPFGLEGTTELVNELCVVRKNVNPAYDDMIPETLLNPEYLDNDFCVIVKTMDAPCAAVANGDLSGLTGVCEFVLVVTMECDDTAPAPFMGFGLDPDIEPLISSEDSLHSIKPASGGCCGNRQN
jgi:hypothetical protein